MALGTLHPISCHHHLSTHTHAHTQAFIYPSSPASAPFLTLAVQQLAISLSLLPVMFKLMEGLVIVCMVPRCLSSPCRHPPSCSTVDYDKPIWGWGWGVKRLDWGSVISSGCGGTPGWDKRVFPETPLTFLDDSCFHGETFNKVQIWSCSQKPVGEERCSHFSSLSLPPMALFPRLAGLETDR